MAYPVTLNGRTYTLADFEGNNYVDGLPDAFEDFVTHAGDIYNDTSTTSNSIGTGSKTFTVAAGKPYQAGTPLRIADAASPATNFLDAVVTSYSGTTLVVEAIGYGGSGTLTSWTVNIGGAKTIDGTLGVSQGGTGATTAAAARTNLDTYSKTEADSRFLNVSGEASDVTMTGNVTIGDAGTDTLTINAATTTTADISFGDNDKAIFGGATSELQIYSDGTDSIIADVGTGNLSIQGTNLRLRNVDNTADYITCNDGGDVKLKYANANKLATSASGIDVTGTIDSTDYLTAKGLRIGLDNNNDIYAGTSPLRSTADSFFFKNTTSGEEFIRFQFPNVVINEFGYDHDFRVESDSRTDMFFVDAGANKIGIKTTSPVKPLSLGSRSGSNLSYLNGTTNTVAEDNGIFVSYSTTDEASIGYGLHLANNANTNGARSPIIGFSALSASDSYNHMYAAINGVKAGNGSDTNWNSGNIDFSTGSGTGPNVRMTLDYLGGLTLRPIFQGSFVWNEDGQDADFRVESDSNTNMLLVDAGNNAIVIGNTSPVDTLFNVGEAKTFTGDYAGTIVDAVTADFSGSPSANSSFVRIGSGRYANYGGTDTGFIFQPSGSNNGYYPRMLQTCHRGNNATSAARMRWYLLRQDSSTQIDLYEMNSDGFIPMVDNLYDLGASGNRWDDVYATNGTINTSDASLKEQVTDLSAAELQAATACKALIKKYKWISSVAEKGDDARWHIGVIAQDVQQAFIDAGLDAEDYGLFIRERWWTFTYNGQEESTTKVEEIHVPMEEATEHTRLGVRYNELLAFIIAAL